MKTLKITGLLLGMFLGVTGTASASTVDYTVTFSGPGFSGSGAIAVDSVTDLVQSVTVNGLGGVSVIAPTTPGSVNLYTQSGTGLQWTYDNLFSASGTPFDNAGLLLSFNNTIANIYSVGTQLYLSLSSPTSDYNPGEQISLTVAQTPLPPGLPLFLTAMVGLWFLLGRKKKATDQGAAFGSLGTT